jgi:DNA (cytosine-5)-methyltransferase 1
MTAFYNEIDPAAAHILRHMIDAGVIAPGVVDTRSIKELTPDDVAGFTQVHLFAGGGLWSVAARLAGWPDDAPLWTGSCPCQPFSAAGKGLGTDDPRHLWPDFHRLISACRPPAIMGEQVAGKAGYGWFDGVRTDLEGEGYAARAVDFPACSVDAPHQRNRLYWIAVDDSESIRRAGRAGAGWSNWTEAGNAPLQAGSGVPSDASLAVIQGQPPAGDEPDHRTDARLHANADGGGRAGRQESAEWEALRRTPSERHLLRNGTYWSDAEWLVCHDGKARRAQSGIRFLVDGLPGRVDLWRVGGNAIVPEAAAEVIAAFMDCYGVPTIARAA